MALGVDVELEAERILLAAGLDPDGPHGAASIVRGYLHDRYSIRKVPRARMLGTEGQSCRVGDEHLIFYRSDLSGPRAAFVVLHELAHIHLGELRHCSPELERICDGIAAALQCPRKPFQRAVQRRGRAWTQLALEFSAEAPCVALRYHEVMRIPAALVSAHTVRLSGPANDVLGGDERGIRRLAKAKHLPAGVRRERVPDKQLRLLLSSA